MNRRADSPLAVADEHVRRVRADGAAVAAEVAAALLDEHLERVISGTSMETLRRFTRAVLVRLGESVRSPDIHDVRKADERA